MVDTPFRRTIEEGTFWEKDIQQMRASWRSGTYLDGCMNTGVPSINVL